MAGRTVTYSLKADIGNFRAQLAQASSSTKKLAGDLTALDKDGARMRQGLTSVGNAAGKMGLAAAAGLGASIKAAVDWQSAFAGVQKTVDGTATQMSALEDELRGLATTMPATHQEIAATAEAAGQLGVARGDVTAFTKTMLMLGETTNLTADEAATSLARFSNIMGTSASEVGNLGAAVVGLGNNFATTEAEVVEISTRLAAAGNQAGLTEADLFGIAAAMSSVGVEAEAGGTAMSKVFTSIGDAVRSGEGDLDTFASVAGITAAEFQKLYDSNPSEAIGGFVEGMGRLAASGGDTSAVFKDLGLTDQRLMRAVLSVGSATGTWAEATSLANREFKDGAALTEEYGKRAETTAAQMQVAWNGVKDAAIDVGAATLPAVESVASGVADAASAFSSLPDPVKSTSGALLGLTAVVGGSAFAFTRTVNLVSDTKQAFSDLGIAGGKASKVMKGLGIAAAAVAGVAALGQATGFLARKLDEALPGVQDLTSQLLDLKEGLPGAELSSEFDSLASSIDRIADPGKLTATTDAIQGVFGAFGFEDAKSLREARAEIDLLDQALAGLVSSGGPDAAERAFAELADSQNLTAEGTRELRDLLPGFDEALQGAANQSRIAADGADGAADAVGGMVGPTTEAADAAQAHADALQESTDAMRDARSEAIAGFDAVTAYALAQKEAAEQAKSNSRGINATTEAGRANRDALSGLAAAWNNQSEATKNADGAFRSAKRGFIDTATAMGVPEAKAKRLARQLLEIPTDVKTVFDAETGEFISKKEAVKRGILDVDSMKATPSASLNDAAFQGTRATVAANLARLNGSRANPTANLIDRASYGINGVLSLLRAVPASKTTTVTTVYRTVGRPAPGVGSRYAVADGGIFDGPVKSFADGGVDDTGRTFARVPQIVTGGRNIMWAEPETGWEAYISGKPGMEARNLSILEEAASRLGASVTKFDTGGLSGKDYRQFNLSRRTDAGSEIREFRRAVKDAGVQIPDSFGRIAARARKLDRSLEKATDRLDRIRDDRRDLRRETAGAFDNDPFGNGLEGALLQLRADRNDSNRFRRQLGDAADFGLKGGAFAALAASGDADTASQITSRSQARELQRAFRQASQAQDDLGRFAATERYGAAERRQAGRVRNRSRALERQEKRLEKAVERGTFRGARAGAAGRRKKSDSRRRRNR